MDGCAGWDGGIDVVVAFDRTGRRGRSPQACTLSFPRLRHGAAPRSPPMFLPFRPPMVTLVALPCLASPSDLRRGVSGVWWCS
jgi:hypothetical protein